MKKGTAIIDKIMHTIGEPRAISEVRDALYGLTVFPDPASEYLHIRSGESIQGRAILRNMVGKKVLAHSLNGKDTTIPVNMLPSGVYLLSVQLDDRKELVRKRVLID